jgi:hypothetical protein
MEKRREIEAAEKVEAKAKSDGEAAPKAKKAAVKKAPGAAKPKKKVKKVEIVRLRMTWGIFDNSNQQQATFPYSEKAAAEARLKELHDKGKGSYFLQPVKEPIIEPPSEDAAAAEAKPAKTAKKK